MKRKLLAIIFVSLCYRPVFAAPQKVGDWLVVNGYAYSVAVEGQDNLAVACIADRPALLFVANGVYFEKTNQGDVEYSSDGAQPISSRWLQLPSQDGFYTFSLSLLRGKELVKINAGGRSATFNTREANDAIALVKAKCGGDPS